MSAKHTPGPWTCDWTRAGKNAWKIVGADHLGVATILVTQARDASEKEANARLITAAPLLLQELRGASTQMERAAECIEAGRYDEALLYVRSMSRSRRAAIAEATGEQP